MKPDKIVQPTLYVELRDYPLLLKNDRFWSGPWDDSDPYFIGYVDGHPVRLLSLPG